MKTLALIYTLPRQRRARNCQPLRVPLGQVDSIDRTWGLF